MMFVNRTVLALSRKRISLGQFSRGWVSKSTRSAGSRYLTAPSSTTLENNRS